MEIKEDYMGKWFYYAYGRNAKIVKCRRCQLTVLREPAEAMEKCPNKECNKIMDKTTSGPEDREKFDPGNS